MTVTIEVPPDIEADLVAQASARGLALPQYVEHLLRDQVAAGASASLTPAQRAAAWRESVKGLPHTPPLSDEAISRESLYGDRE
jgi:hypothetical protein